MSEQQSQNTTFTIVTILFIVIILVIVYDYYCFTNPISMIQPRPYPQPYTTTQVVRPSQHPPVTSRVTKNPIENYENKKTDLPTKNTVKFVIYHMPGCGHCVDIMKNPQPNGKTKFEELRTMFANDRNVQILDFELGKDPEADKFKGFPEIQIVTEKGSISYGGARNVKDMANAIIKQK
jgi:hypothetical protein